MQAALCVEHGFIEGCRWRLLALEQHVLEEVCHPGLAVAFVARADEVGDVDGHGRLRGVGEQQDLEAVVERVLGDVRIEREHAAVEGCGDARRRAPGPSATMRTRPWAAAVPARKSSSRGGSPPPSKAMRRRSTPAARGGAFEGAPACRCASAPPTPAPRRWCRSRRTSARRWRCPPTRRPCSARDQPTAQLSRMSLLVPVFTAVQKRVASTLSSAEGAGARVGVGQDVADDEGGARVDGRAPRPRRARRAAVSDRGACSAAVGQRAVGIGRAPAATPRRCPAPGCSRSSRRSRAAAGRRAQLLVEGVGRDHHQRAHRRHVERAPSAVRTDTRPLNWRS